MHYLSCVTLWGLLVLKETYMLCGSCRYPQHRFWSVFLDPLIDKSSPFAGLNQPGLLSMIRPCCRATILSHVQHNPMMVCPDCKTMIKCFTEARASQNYEVFCRSRNRKIASFFEGGVYFVMFNSFLTASQQI
jgi:hypothetical protein